MTTNRNVPFIITLEALWGFGVAFVSFDIISALIYSLGGNATLIALVSTMSCVLTYGPQLFGPYFQQRIRHNIGGAALGQSFMVLGFVLTGTALLTLQSKGILLAIVVACEIMRAMGSSFNNPFYQQMRLRLFPSRTRSAIYSTVLFFAQISGILGAALAIPLLNAFGGPAQINYVWCYVAATVFAVFSTCCYTFLRDPNPPAPVSEVKPLTAFLREYVESFRHDRNLRVFLLSEWMNWLSALGSTFVAFYAVKNLGEGIAPQLSFTRTVAMLAAVPLAHMIVTRKGPRAAIIAFYLCAIAYFIPLLLHPTRITLLTSALFTGVAVVLRLNYMFHFIAALCPHSEKSKYYALTSFVVFPATMIGPFLGDLLLKLGVGYRPLFALSIVPLLAGLWLAWRVLKDPVLVEDEVSPIPRVTLKRMTN